MPQKNHNPKKKKRKLLNPFYTVLLVLIVICIVLCFTVAHYVNMINIVNTGTRNIISISEDLISEKNVRNILLIGTDSRDSSDRGRSDTIILLSVNEHTQNMTMVSLMRDMYVDIPNYGKGKINAAYSHGGAELLMDTVEENFGIRVDDYIAVNFSSFAGIVDAVGGVEITLSDAEAAEVNNILRNEVNELMGDPKDADFLEKGGTYRLSGKQALCYSRIRYVGDADFERTERQRTVLNQIVSEARTLNIFKLDSLLSDALPQMTTNISKNEMYGYAIKAPMYIFKYDIVQMRVPVDGSWSYADIDGESVISVDFNDNIISLAENLYEIQYDGN